MSSVSRVLKSAVLTVCILSVFLLTGCFKHQSRCPADYPGSVWESASPHIILKINEEGDMILGSARPESQAFMEIDGELRQVYFCFSPVSVCAPIYDREMCDEAGLFFPEAMLLDTKCHYFKNYIVMEIVEDHIYGGEYRYVIFERVK